MVGKATDFGLMWDFAIPQAIDQSQRWILSTMQKYGPELVMMLWRILGNEQDVCDAYQNTFLQLAHYQDRNKPEHIKAYIFRTATNSAISILRIRIAEKEKLHSAIVYHESTSSSANEVDFESLQEVLRCCIARLPENLRNVITLRDLAELSYAQIGRMLGISAATARVYRCKAIQLLSVWMNKSTGHGASHPGDLPLEK
jgi:RNA polymerase sigma-70 factor (ECF subfamily)